MSREVDHLLALAHDRMVLGDPRGAIETYKEALSLDPDHPEAHALLAFALVNRKRLFAAEMEASTAVTLAPDSGLPHHAMGVVRTAQRRFDDALEHLEHASHVDPSSTGVLVSLALLHSLAARRAEALAVLERARAMDPEDPDTLAALGETYLEAGRITEAEACARAAMEAAPGHFGAVVLMGNVLLQSGDMRGARDHAAWALRHDATSPSALHLLASIKARGSLLLGLWWRYSVWLEKFGDGRQLGILVGAYLAYRVLSLYLEKSGQSELENIVDLIWLAFCAYTWIGPSLFRRSLAKELEQVRLSRDY
jgi:Flp pilus assembly protein TadD